MTGEIFSANKYTAKCVSESTVNADQLMKLS